jgi:hypothetical protein
LVVVDIRRTEPAVLERYVGREGVVRFRKHHGLPTFVAYIGSGDTRQFRSPCVMLKLPNF